MAGWPAKGGTWAISRRSSHRSVIATYWTLADGNAAANGCIDRLLHGASQEYFTIRCGRRGILTAPSAFPANNAQPEGLALATIEPYMSVANCILRKSDQ
jgi:hypothetical protein